MCFHVYIYIISQIFKISCLYTHIYEEIIQICKLKEENVKPFSPAGMKPHSEPAVKCDQTRGSCKPCLKLRAPSLLLVKTFPTFCSSV